MLHLGRVGAVSVIVLAVGCGSAAPPIASTQRPEATAGPTPLATAIRGLVAAFGGTAGIVVAFPGVPEPVYAADADTPFIAASLYKLAVLLRVESLVESGTLSYDDTITIADADVTIDGSNEPAGTVLTIDEALEEMITYSDNGSALALLRVFGAPATNARILSSGITGFHVAESADEDNVVTARALGTFFDQLATRRLVSPAASDRMLARLQRQTINDRLPRDLPAGVAVAHKTGDLIGFVHDAGLIQAADGPRIAVVLTAAGTEADADDLIATVGALVYSAVLTRPAAARVDPLPAAQSPWSRFGIGAAALLAIGGLSALAVLVTAGRSGRRQARRRSGPLTVWSPERGRRRR
ncbi:MAG TPA: serine hydrolase [Candidatus Limnocylindria bacterium]|nr:serine hydrolase [Candidatus Limnocylindria bacterium]